MLQLQPERLLFQCLPRDFKKLVPVLATSAIVTVASKEADGILEQIPYINYLFYF